MTHIALVWGPVGMSEQPQSASVIVGKKVAVLALAIVAIGLPINDLFDYAVLAGAAVIVFVGRVEALPSRWLAAVLLAGAVAAGHMLLPAPQIEEGHNVFLPGPDAAKTSGLPAPVLQYLDRQFAEQYPPDKRCGDPSRGCWRPDRSAAQDGFALSSDGLFQGGAYSRRVTGIDFSDPVHARLGVVNDLIYNWSPNASDIQRFDRDRRSLNLFDRFHMMFPLYIMYRFPAAFAGSVLCWRGDVLWEGADERFDVLSHPAVACREIAAADAGRRIVAVAIKLDRPLAITLKPNWTVWLRDLFARGLTLAGVIGILGLLARIAPRKLVWPALLIGLSLLVIVIDDINFIGGLRPLDAGDDGMTYEGYARNMIRGLIAGDIAGVLRGNEPVYYFTPGFRYVSVVEHLIFGETYLGYLSLVLALPFLVFALFRRFVPEIWARVVVLGFVATPLGALFGSAFLYYVKWAARGFADSCGYILLLAGMVVLIPRAAEADDPPAAPAFAGALLLSLATFVRPNVALASGVMIAGAVLLALWRRKVARAGAIVAGFATLIVSPLHNWVFGHSTVLFSDNVSQPQTLVMPPSAYFEAARDLLHLDFASDHVIAAIKKLAWWLSGPGNIYPMIPLNLAAVAILVRVGFFGARFDPWLRLVALATLLEHGTGICYADWDRYHLVTWLLTALVATAWLWGEGLPLLDKAFPGLRARLGTHAAIRRPAAAIARLS
ncbi:MAG TPA: hypothetical protein VLX44_09980 [Xanthobacteraceae bacterium]|nr:hypothetical protein [Xanthobacteraceae bacterium]